MLRVILLAVLSHELMESICAIKSGEVALKRYLQLFAELLKA